MNRLLLGLLALAGLACESIAPVAPASIGDERLLVVGRVVESHVTRDTVTVKVAVVWTGDEWKPEGTVRLEVRPTDRVSE